MTREIPLQFKYTDDAEKEVLIWAESNDVKLYKVHVVVPFVLSDKSLDVWLFFDSDNLVKAYEKNGIADTVKQKYLDILKNNNYPQDYLSKVTFWIDSHENVVKNFDGNYFYRLR